MHAIAFKRLRYCLLSLVLATVSNAVLAERWTLVDEIGRPPHVQRRYIDLDSIRKEGNSVTYQFQLEISGTTNFSMPIFGASRIFERPAVTDCRTQMRFEVTHPDDWVIRPFKPIYANTWQAKELLLVCNQTIARGPDPTQASRTPSSQVETSPAIRPALSTPAQAAPAPPVERQQALNSILGKRVALVIGNAKYQVRPLRNPENDANDISAALKSSGFEVIDIRNATLAQMRQAVRQFGDRLLQSDVGLVYYSGHGVEVRGRNYFIPVNADIQKEDEIADQGLDVYLILEKMATAKRSTNILIVDACRDDPFGRAFRSTATGLASMEAPRGTIIAYATSPGRVAADGDGRNSPYTKHLLRAMQIPNMPIEQVFKEVRRAVQTETQERQTPWENTSLSGDFYFRVQR